MRPSGAGAGGVQWCEGWGSNTFRLQSAKECSLPSSSSGAQQMTRLCRVSSEFCGNQEYKASPTLHSPWRFGQAHVSSEPKQASSQSATQQTGCYSSFSGHMGIVSQKWLSCGNGMRVTSGHLDHFSLYFSRRAIWIVPRMP